MKKLRSWRLDINTSEQIQSYDIVGSLRQNSVIWCQPRLVNHESHFFDQISISKEVGRKVPREWYDRLYICFSKRVNIRSTKERKKKTLWHLVTNVEELKYGGFSHIWEFQKLPYKNIYKGMIQKINFFCDEKLIFINPSKIASNMFLSL